MSVDSRRISRLSLRVQRREDVQRAANTLSEALRLASLPGDGQPGRLFIRRIELPALRLDGGAYPVAAALESCVREMRRSAIAISDPRAARADAVFSRDEVEPLVLALVRASRGRHTTEWFWPRIHPELHARAPPERVSARVWRMVSERADASAVVPAVVGAILDTDPEPEVFTAIDTMLGETLALKLAVPLVPAQHWPAVVDLVVPSRWRQAMIAAIAAWDHDVRAAWLVTAALRALQPWNTASHLPSWSTRAREPQVEEPREPTSNVPSESVARGGESRAESAARAGGHPPPATDRLSPSAPTAAPVIAAPDQAPSTTATPPTRPSPATRDTASALAPKGQPTPEALPPSPRWALLERPSPTRFGGLLFLVHPLARLGMEAFLDQHAVLQQHAFGLHVLARIADTLHLPPEDPMRLPLQAPDLAEDMVVPAPPTWGDVLPADRIPPPPQTEGSEGLILAWTLALRAYLEHVAELDLLEVVERDAAMTCSRTHVDVIFDMERSDLRIRKAGLDIDPGFVWWFGRVIKFHYVFGGMLDA